MPARLALIVLFTQGHGVATSPTIFEPTVPLDARVSMDKATTQPTVAPTATLVPAIPVLHRIASSAAEAHCSEASYNEARESISRALGALRAAQSPSGAWMERAPVAATDQKKPSMAACTAVTALGLKAFAQCGLDPKSDSSANRARRFLYDELGPARASFSPDAEGGLGTYVASAVASGLAAVDDPADRPLIERTIEWLSSTQWDQSEGVSPKLDWFGGSGYGSRGRPDLSNTQMMLDALHDAGVSPEDPAVQRALVFLTRTQNNASTNPAPWAQSGASDGGFVYTPANGGESFSSEASGEGRYGETMPADAPRSLRSYGSMTYAGFKSLLFAGLSRNDPRVRASLSWIAAHWTFAENPGLGQQGYYYFVHAMARALAAAQVDEVTDASGVKHRWREELIAELRSRQRADGSFVNTASRWEESEPDLCTIYAALALEEAIKPSPTPR